MLLISEEADRAAKEGTGLLVVTARVMRVLFVKHLARSRVLLMSAHNRGILRESGAGAGSSARSLYDAVVRDADVRNQSARGWPFLAGHKLENVSGTR